MQPGAADAHPEVAIGDRDRCSGMGEPGITGTVDILDGTERPFVFLALGALVDETAVLAVERNRVIIAFDNVLTDFRPDAFQEEA